MEREELSEKLADLEMNEDFSSEEAKALLTETVGSLFAASKEVKAEELYRVIPGSGEPVKSFEDFWVAEDGYILFNSDPITPFLINEAAVGDEVTLLTFRKAVTENPLALMLEGFPENSTVFDILAKDGLEENGKENYLLICAFIKKMLNASNPGCEFIEAVKALLENGEKCGAYCYSAGEAEYFGVEPEYAQMYYLCTSSILCRLADIEESGEIIKIEPLMHNSSVIRPGEEVEYDDFGEVGCFTFEMNDYRY